MKKETFGESIARMRKEKGMTQQELADKMGITGNAVSKWERDLSLPDTAALPRLAELFGLTVDELMQGRAQAGKDKDIKDPQKLTLLILRAVALAMGVAVTVLGILGEIETGSALTMLGTGLACLAVSALAKNRE